MMLHILGALLLPLCGWLAGDAIQARTVQHLAALQKCLALLERIRQEVAFRRADLQQLYAELCREGILESGARCLQEAPPPEGLTREEQQCFRTCMSGLGRAEAQQECEQLDYYRARLQALQQTAEHAARRQAGLPRKLGLACVVLRRMERRFALSILFQQQLLEMLGNRLSFFMGEMNLHNFRQVALIQEIHFLLRKYRFQLKI